MREFNLEEAFNKYTNDDRKSWR